MPNEKESAEQISFHCRSPIYMCATCTHAENCQDLLNILRMFRLKEKPEEFDYLTNFPFLKPRSFKHDERNRFNELSSGEWLRFTRTVFSSMYPKVLGHELRCKHPEYKSPHLIGQLISFFTKKEDLVFDPFAGTGTTLLAAALLGRESIGFEISTQWVDIYYRICKKHRIPRQKLVEGDCSELIYNVPKESVDFIVIDPPNPLKTDDWHRGKSEPASPIDAYFDFMLKIFNRCYISLKDQKYLAIFTRNLYQNGRYIYLTPYFATMAADAGFVLKGEKIWENSAEKLRPYGYPHSYVPNIVHYNILFFQKREGEEEEEAKIDGS
ncbi:MAG TPA: class I SAM-dependent methyltransferase [bacterium]|nr:class I SAM-dependent methyltransferase [bacterium]